MTGAAWRNLREDSDFSPGVCRMDVSYVWLLAASLMLFHQNQASAVSITGPTAEEGPLVQLNHMAHRREKRCSCENQKDKECIFFCHIGIVWVNSPSHVVPYGFGSVRLRRQLRRCFCTNTQDDRCMSFCSVHTQTEGENTDVKKATDPQLKKHTGAFWEKRSRHTLRPLREEGA